MKRAEFNTVVTNYVVAPGEPGGARHVQLKHYRAAQLLFRGITVPVGDSVTPQRQVAAFDVITADGEQAYHILQADTHTGGLVATSMGACITRLTDDGHIFPGGFREDTLTLPVAGCDTVPRLGDLVLHTEYWAYAPGQHQTLPAPAYAAVG